MERLYLRVRAPFAAFRWMQSGVYRASSPVVPPSAAWGLALHLAGVETRAVGDGATTLVRADAPPLRVAVGDLRARPAEASVLYQQLHAYPVSVDEKGKALRQLTRGAKFWIAPARREVLVDLDVVVALETLDGSLLRRIRDGLDGRLDAPRYGLPFAGDNNLLIDRLDVLGAPPPTRWYSRVEPGAPPRPFSCRLTVGIDREDNSRTTSAVFAPIEVPESEPPEGAWTWTPRPPS